MLSLSRDKNCGTETQQNLRLTYCWHSSFCSCESILSQLGIQIHVKEGSCVKSVAFPLNTVLMVFLVLFN